MDAPVPEQEAQHRNDRQILCDVSVTSQRARRSARRTYHDRSAHVLAAVWSAANEHEDASDEVGDEGSDEQQPQSIQRQNDRSRLVRDLGFDVVLRVEASHPAARTINQSRTQRTKTSG